MARVTVESVANKVDNVITDVNELKISKADKAIVVLELESVKKDVNSLNDNITRINSYGRWIVLTVGSLLIAAVLAVVGLKR